MIFSWCWWFLWFLSLHANVGDYMIVAGFWFFLWLLIVIIKNIKNHLHSIPMPTCHPQWLLQRLCLSKEPRQCRPPWTQFNVYWYILSFSDFENIFMFCRHVFWLLKLQLVLKYKCGLADLGAINEKTTSLVNDFLTFLRHGNLALKS